MIWMLPAKLLQVLPEVWGLRLFKLKGVNKIKCRSGVKNIQNQEKGQIQRTNIDFAEAVKLAIDSSYAKFDETVDVAVRLGVDPRHADQMVRGTVVLPNGLGKEVKVLVFAKGEKEKEAIDAGADFVGNDDLIEKIKEAGLVLIKPLQHRI